MRGLTGNKRLIFLCLISFFISLHSMVLAKEYKGTSQYYIADIATKEIAVGFARDLAKRSALEQAGTLVSSLSESSKGILTKDEVETIALGFATLKPGTEVTDFSVQEQNGMTILFYSAIFDIDENEVANNLKAYKQNNPEVENAKLQVLRQQMLNKQMEAEYKNLQNKYAMLKTEKEKSDYQASINEIQGKLNAFGYFKVATNYLQNKDYTNALNYFDKALNGFNEYAGNNPPPWISEFLASILFQKGMIYQTQQQFSQALSLYKAATQVAPNLVYPYPGIAIIYTQLGNETEALLAANTAVKLRPDDDSYYGRMTVYASFNKIKEACDDFWKLKDPYSKARYAGWLYLKVNDWKNALKVFDMALKFDSLDVASHHGRGRANAGLRNDQEAVKDFTKAVTLDPSDFHAYAERGASYLYLKQYQLAYNDAILALSKNPNDDVALWVIAELNKKNLMK